MTYETVEQLKQGNTAFVSEADLAAINALIERIEAQREGEIIPRIGDRLICQLDTGDVHVKHALIDTIYPDTGRISICVGTHWGSTHIIPETLTLSTSGGPWFGANAEELEYVGKVPGQFWTWNWMGPGADHGINFLAEVNYWRITAPRHRFI